MRILAIYRHYYPDTTPYARNLRQILEHLVEDGHTACVITAQPSYNDVRQPKQPDREVLGGVLVIRLGMLPERKSFLILRAINYLWFLLCSIAYVLIQRRFDLILANSHPPVLMGMALRVIRKFTRIPYLLHYQDIHPECAVLSGHLKPGFLTRLLLAQDSKNCRNARCIVTLSEDMRQTLTQRAISSSIQDKIVLINNPPLRIYRDNAAADLPGCFRDDSSADPSTAPFRILFAGNIGQFQQLDRLIASATHLVHKPYIRFIIMGAGMARRSLEKQAGTLVNRTVFFVPHQSVETTYHCMRCADLGVVSLKTGLTQVAYPSKMMTYLATGLPLLILVDDDESELVRDAKHFRFGYTPTTLTPAAIAATIEQAASERGLWTADARSALIKRYEARFGSTILLDHWSGLVRTLEARSNAGDFQHAA